MASTTPVRPGRAPQVAPALPLALLEAVRSHDRPGEVLEDEDLTASMPRRLGLTGVIHTQIRRYESAYAARKKVPLPEVADLMKLILRRPDAPTILEETGRRMTRLVLDRRMTFTRRFRRVLPRGVLFAGIRRAAVRLLEATNGGAPVKVVGKPLAVRMEGGARLQIDQPSCQLYTGALEELVVLYTGAPSPVEHVLCVTRGDGACEWMSGA
jgi:predicted hydrocarbon binding protein